MASFPRHLKSRTTLNLMKQDIIRVAVASAELYANIKKQKINQQTINNNNNRFMALCLGLAR